MPRRSSPPDPVALAVRARRGLAPAAAAAVVAVRLAELRFLAPPRLRDAAQADALPELLGEMGRRWRMDLDADGAGGSARDFALALSTPGASESLRALGAEAVGLVYERLLERAQARRSGAVYTPAPLLRYIAERALSSLGDGAQPPRVVDPACGAGFFLLELGRRLAARGHSWPRILEHLYGIEIDPRAAALARASLALEAGIDPGEARDPIACGDAVLGPAPGLARFSPLCWEDRFSEVFAAGGFDAVVGNPPYLGIDATYGRGDPRLAALQAQYPEVHTDKTDLSYYFLARALQVSRGVVSFLVSRAFLEAFKAAKLRAHLAAVGAPAEIIDFRDARVFPRTGVSACILTLDRAAASRPLVAYRLRRDDLPAGELRAQLADPDLFERTAIPRQALGSAPWSLASPDEQELCRAIDAQGEPLGEVLLVGQGMQTGLNAAFAGLGETDVRRLGLSEEQHFRRATGTDLAPFSIRDRGERVLYPESCRSFSELPEAAQRHLESHRPRLVRRAAFLRGNCEWWRYSFPLHRALYRVRRRILCPYLAARNAFALDAGDRFLSLTDTTVLFDNGQPEDLRYLLGLLNSPILEFRFRALAKLKGAGLYEYFWNSVSKLPIRRIDFGHAGDRALHDQMVALVERSMAAPDDPELARGRLELTFELYRLPRAARRSIVRPSGRPCPSTRRPNSDPG